MPLFSKYYFAQKTIVFIKNAALDLSANGNPGALFPNPVQTGKVVLRLDQKQNVFQAL